VINIVENKQKSYIFVCVYKIIGIRNIDKQRSECCTLKMVEVSMSQRMQSATRCWKSKEMDSLLEPPD